MAGHRKCTTSLSKMQYLIMRKNRPPFCLSAYFIYLCKRGKQALSWLRRRAGHVVYVCPILIEIQLIKEK